MAKRRRTPTDAPVLLDKVEDARFRRIASAGLAILTLAVFANTLPNQFVNWDDHALIVNNPATESLAPSALLHIFTPELGRTYQPVRVLSYAIDRALWGVNPIGYHIVNTLLHTAAAILLFLALCRALPKLRPSAPSHSHRLVAIFAALLFALHPVNVEAVAWMSSRKYGLLAVFGFAAFLAFVRGRAWLTLVLTLFAMLSSPFGVTLPPLFVLFDCCRGQPVRALLRSHWPLILLELLMLPVLFLLLTDSGGGGIMRDYPELSTGERLLTMLRCLSDYARNLVCPLWLNARYPHVASTTLVEAKVLLGLLIIVAAAIFTWRRLCAGDRVIPFCAAWAFVAWLPVSNLVPISTFMADRYLYLPAVGIFIAVAVAAEHLSRCGLRKHGTRNTLILAAILPLLLSVITVRRNADWRSSLSLWQASVATEMSGVSLTLLGSAYEETKDFEQAADHYRRALELAPDFPFAANNLGAILREAGQYQQALPLLQTAVAKEPGYRDAHYNLGTVLSDLQRDDEAIPHLETAIALAPQGVNAYNNLGIVLMRQAKLPEARAQLEAALAIDAEYAPAHYLLGDTLFRLGEHAAAIPHLDFALKTRPDYASGFFLLGVCHQQTGADEQAIAQFRRVVALQPQSVEALTSLAWLLATRAGDDYAEARQFANSAVQLSQGKDFAALDALAAAQAASGAFAQAIATGNQALSLAPAKLQPEIRARIDLYQNARPYTRP
jgi:tetratricopeptide (TPR) repeat protein